MIRVLLPLLISTALVLPAAAQEAPPAQPDEEAAEAAPAPQPQIERPYEAPPSEVGPIYDARVQGRIGAAQSQRGRLDGGWILTDQSGTRLYALQFSQTSDNGLEGAWRDLRRGGVAALGVMDEVTETGGELVALLPGSDPAKPTRLVLRPDAGGWAGEIREGGAARSVTARRDPISAAWDSYTPGASTRPFVAGAPKAALAQTPAVKKKAVKRKPTGKRKPTKRKRRR